MYEKLVAFLKSFQGSLGDNEIIISDTKNKFNCILSGNELVYVTDNEITFHKE